MGLNLSVNHILSTHIESTHCPLMATMKESSQLYSPYEILDQIGRGSYASVHKAIVMQTGEICAIKKIQSTNSELPDLITEIGIISECKCKNIVRFLDSKWTGEEVLIVMEYCAGGSVKDVMRQLNRTMTVEQITVIVRDVLVGLDYLHSSNKIHRDVKAANILLNEEGIAKLGDFGVSEPLDTNSATRKRPITGTLLWLPPEVINQDPNYSTAIDIWSLGITVVEMGDGEPPFNNLDSKTALGEIANMEKPAASFKDQSKWPQDLIHFVSLCLEKDASKRKNARELLAHDLINTKCPSNDVIKSLVAEASSNIKNQSEASLYKKYKALKKESSCLEIIYQNRRMKCIRVDRMTDLHRAVEKEFNELENSSRQRNLRINDSLSQLESMKEEIQKLQREKSELISHLDEKRNRKLDLDNELKKIRQKLEDESIRRNKLRALESKM